MTTSHLKAAPSRAGGSDADPQVVGASVIIPTYDKAKYLERTLASWLHQRSEDYELIVIDDGSTDRTAEVLRRFSSRLPLRALHTENGGRSAARNRGLGVARGKVIIFSDDDRVVSPGFVEAHTSCHMKSEDGCVVIGWQNGLLTEVRPDQCLTPERLLQLVRTDPECERALIEGRAFDTITALDVEHDFARVVGLHAIPEPAFERVMLAASPGGDELDGALAWMFGATGNFSVRREALDLVGSFDERFRGWGLEDTELHYRLSKCGLKTRVQRSAINYHQNHPRDKQAMAKSFMANARHFFAKHQSLETALFIQFARLRITLTDAEQVLREARSMPDSRLLEQFKQLLYEDVAATLLRRELACVF